MCIYDNFIIPTEGQMSFKKYQNSISEEKINKKERKKKEKRKKNEKKRNRALWTRPDYHMYILQIILYLCS